MTARLALVLALAGCGIDTAECPTVQLDETVHASAADVAPIIARACAVGGCHLRAPGAGELVLDAGWRAALVGVPAQQHPAMALVAPGSPEQSWLVAKLEGGFCGMTCAQGCGAAMPPGEPLPAAERAIIAAWIRDGAR